MKGNDVIHVKADLTKCQGYANCVMAAPEAFDLGPDGKVIVLGESFDEHMRPEIEEAVRSCPTNALRISDQ